MGGEGKEKAVLGIVRKEPWNPLRCLHSDWFWQMREVPALSYFIAYSSISTGLSPSELCIHARLWHQGTQQYQHDAGAETER